MTGEKHEFTCRMIATLEDADDMNAFVVIFYENVDSSGERLELQRTLSFDEQDRRMGMDTYCTVLSSGASHYGGLERCVLRGNRLALEFDDTARRALGVARRLVITMEVDGSSLEQARTVLRRILADGRSRPRELEL